MNPFQNWSSWSSTPLGRTLIAQEQAWLDESLQDVFGYQAVQFGPVSLDALRLSRMSCRTRVVCGHETQASLLGDETANLVCAGLEELPFATQSIDLLVLPHTLEVSGDPHHLLREAERVLIPEGKLVITGFNPFSLWVLRKRCRSVNQFPPAGHDWIALPRIKDWLKLLNFDLGAAGASAYAGYVPPVDSQRWLDRLGWMDPAGRRWWPMAGGVYMFMAVKRVSNIQLIGAGWRQGTKAARKAVTAASAQMPAPDLTRRPT